jgi:hypothetical protein
VHRLPNLTDTGCHNGTITVVKVKTVFFLIQLQKVEQARNFSLSVTDQ